MWQLVRTLKAIQHALDELNRQLAAKKMHHEQPNPMIEQVLSAFKNNEMLLYYQPKLNWRTGQPTGFEALIRWRHPTQGLLSPADFLPQIEHTDLIITLGEWVLEETLRQVQHWHNVGAGFIKVSINISGRHVMHPTFSQRMRQIMSRHPYIPLSCIEFEILESSSIDNLPHVARIIDEFRAEGVQFSIDDFGTGYASLSYLQHLSVNTLKIDRTFICHMLHNTNDQALVEATISLAQVFHCEVVAEGVESLEQAHALMQLGCDHMQGYAIAQPMPGDDIPLWINQLKHEPDSTANKVCR